MKAEIRNRWVAAASLANLLLLREFTFLLGWGGDSYFCPDVNLASFSGLALGWVTLTFAIYPLFWRDERENRRYLAAGAGLLLIALSTWVLYSVREFTQLSVNYPVFSARYFLGDWGLAGNRFKLAMIGLTLLVLLFRFHKPIRIANRAIVSLLFPLLVFTIVKSGFYVTNYMYRTHPTALPARTAPAGRRVVWMIFDETAEHFIDANRPSELKLPALDRFRAEAVQATQAYSPADATALSLPALLTGRRVFNARRENRYSLQLDFCDSATGQTFGDKPTLFSKAREQGERTALLGWFHPYCRLFGKDLDHCMPLRGSRDYSLSAFKNVGRILRRVVVGEPEPAMAHAMTFQAMRRQTLELLSSTEKLPEVIFLHWPIPHLQEIPRADASPFTGYDGETISYLRNLELMDRTFSEVRAALEKIGEWDASLVLVSSDHWWRMDPALHTKLPDIQHEHWRIPFLVKLPGQREGARYDKPFNTVVTRALVEAVRRGELVSAADTMRWLDTHGEALPPLHEKFPQRMHCEDRLPWLPAREVSSSK